MKKIVLIVLSMLFVFAAASLCLGADKGPKGKFEARVGDTIYVCSCGAGCDCGSLAKKEGKCGCGKDLVKTTVSKIENGKVFYKLGDKEQSALIKGKYACGCGDCNCGSVSQKPGKCGCGKEMVKVK